MPRAKGRGQTQQQTRQTPVQQSLAAEGLPDAHRCTLLQVLMARGWMAEAEAKAIFAQLDKLAGGGSSYAQTISDINSELSFLLLAIVQLRYLVDNKTYVGFVNREGDEAAKDNGSSFSPSQMQFLRGVIEAIALDPAAEQGIGSVSSIEAVNVNFSASLTQASQASQVLHPLFETPKSLSMSEKEAVLDISVKEGWLSALGSRKGYYTLGVRTFMELGEQLLEFNLPEETRQAWEQML